ncbi:MAG: phosphoenolpyruvate--protein phosphotransferase [Clostridiales bacterium 38-18]|nr:MAG: phosphoenolpyruvate--protein phosphotransferase [Clostridiales bacterium 38-18]
MIKGIAASKGYAIGKIKVMRHIEWTVDLTPAVDCEKELTELKKSVEASREQLKAIRDNTAKNIGEHEAMVFDSHMMFLDDPEFVGAMEEAIKSESKRAVAAVEQVKNFFKSMFEQMDNDYMKERAADIVDVSNRLIKNLLGLPTDNGNLEANTIIVAHDLTPSDTAQLDKTKVIGFLTDIGGTTSHSAIMARSLEICAVVGLGDITDKVTDGMVCIMDGVKGEVILSPSHSQIEEYEALAEAYRKKREDLKKYKDIKLSYKEGREILVAGNIGSVKDLDTVIENGADGIGLFRTEFVFMDRASAPTEDEQYEIYKTVAERMSGKPVVIRTLDIGGDKQIDYLEMEPEMNPFLGLRAIRLCFKYVDLFKAQIRALLRASVHGDVNVMLPMIGAVEEIKQAKAIIEECKAELRAEGIDFNEEMPVGIMIEIPAAAVAADILAEEVDFFSIGTNDLIQYTLAVDRMNSNISHLYNPMNPSVLRLIEMTIKAAHNAGIWCGMCGEMAGDLRATEVLLSMGLDEFSMSGSSILDVKEKIFTHLK